jgi:ParB/RepB/Spo0J family partition protein
MNAPVPATAIELQSLQHVALASLTLSRTHIQELRRARFTKEATAELALSIGKVGILQAIVARPLDGSKFEIVAGERRFLAAKQAGLAVLPVNVRELTDEQVLEVQLIENLQREGLHELEEAEGYDELMKLKKINSDVVAGMVGKSRSYVYARTKLLALCPEARKAFYAGELDSSTALEIARIPPHELQQRAMKDLEDWRRDGEVTNFREAKAHIREHYMIRLKKAPFDRNDAQLLPAAGSCAACPKRSGNQSDLLGELKDADVCTDPKCFDQKRQAHFAGARKAQEAKGKKVIAGDAAKKLLPHWEDGDVYMSHGAPYRKLGDTTYLDSGATRKVGDVVGKDYNSILIQHPLTGKFVEVATQEAIAKASKAGKKGSASKGGIYNYGAATARAKAKGPDVDDMLNDRLAKLIHEKAPAAFGKPWLLVLVGELREQLSLRNDDSVAKAWGWKESAFQGSRGYGRSVPAEVAKLSERDLVLFMFDMVFACSPYTRDGVLKQFGINEQKTRELIIEERKEAARKERAEAKAKKEAAKKPAPAAAELDDKWPFITGAKSPQVAKKKPAKKKKAIAKKKPAARKKAIAKKPAKKKGKK